MNRVGCIMKYLLGLFILLCIGGCASWRGAVKLGETDLTFNRKPVSGFEIVYLKAFRIPEGLFVKGLVKRRDYEDAFKTEGHIDLIVRNEEGVALGQASIPYHPKVVSYIKKRSSRFNVILKGVPETSLVMDVIQHEGSTHEVDRQLEHTGPDALLGGFPI